MYLFSGYDVADEYCLDCCFSGDVGDDDDDDNDDLNLNLRYRVENAVQDSLNYFDATSETLHYYYYYTQMFSYYSTSNTTSS